MLKSIFGKGKGTKALTASPLAPNLQSTILQSVGFRSIPSMPAAAQKAFELSSDPNAEARDYIEVIESDEALSARVLKIANSVFFDRGRPSKTVEEAVVVIGMNELSSLLNATTLSEIFPSRHPLRGQLWSHDIAVAIVARALAMKFSPQQADLSFMGGLMHDIGKLILIQRITDDYEKVMQLVLAGKSFPEAESEVFPFDHTEVGQLIAEKWNFSSDLINIIRNHHQSFSRIKEHGNRTPLMFVTAADVITHALGFGQPRPLSRLRKSSEEKLAELGMCLGSKEEDWKETLTGLHRTLELEYELLAHNL